MLHDKRPIRYEENCSATDKHKALVFFLFSCLSILPSVHVEHKCRTGELSDPLADGKSRAQTQEEGNGSVIHKMD